MAFVAKHLPDPFHLEGTTCISLRDAISREVASNILIHREFLIGHDTVGREARGCKYSSYLVVVTDSRGDIIAHKTPKKWLFENYENLKEIPVGRYIDKTCTRVRPTRPKTLYY